MYKHKPGIQKDKYGFNESVNITDKKVKNLQHMIYDVVEPMILEQEKKDKNLKFRLDGHGGSVLENLKYPAKHLIFNYKHGRSNHVYKLEVKDVSVNYDENGKPGLKFMDVKEFLNKTEPNWVIFKKDTFYFYEIPDSFNNSNYMARARYHIEYDRCNTQNKFTDWVQHLNAKNWVHKIMLGQFMKLADETHKEKTGEHLIGWGSMTRD